MRQPLLRPACRQRRPCKGRRALRPGRNRGSRTREEKRKFHAETGVRGVAAVHAQAGGRGRPGVAIIKHAREKILFRADRAGTAALGESGLGAVARHALMEL